LATRSLRAVSAATALGLLVSTWPGVAAQTGRWTGVISDSMCRRHHESGAEGQETTDPDCTRDCVNGGSKYVLVDGETVYVFANQEHPGLSRHAGARVTVTGALRGEAIDADTIEPAR
jgi:hypothetical protein